MNQSKKRYLQIFLFFLIWRLLLFLVAFFAQSILPVFGNRFPYVEILKIEHVPFWIYYFGNFDGVHYLGIAQHGYANQFTQAFFPLYPILVGLISNITFGNFLIAALILSNLTFLGSLVLLYKLIESRYGKKIAIWSCIFLLSFPTSFYFGAVYTEGLFFLFIVATFYFLEQKKLIIASLIGSFASATRLAGVFLAVSIIKKNGYKSLIPMLIVPLGLIGYMIYLKIEFNNPFYFLTAQNIWGQERSTSEIILLPQVVWRYIKILLTTSGLPLFNAVLELSATAFAFIVLLLATYKFPRPKRPRSSLSSLNERADTSTHGSMYSLSRIHPRAKRPQVYLASEYKVKSEWLIFSWLAVITPTLTGTLTSMPRYILIAFPIYIVLAHIKSHVVKILLVTSFIILQAILVILFTRGYWVA